MEGSDSLFSFSSSTHFTFASPQPSPDSTKKPLPPPCLRIPFSDSHPSASGEFGVGLPSNNSTVSDPIPIHDSLTLYKGRVSTYDVFGVGNSDLLPGKYEGGLKLWEGSLDLVKLLSSLITQGSLSLKGMCVLEIGCGHGLPGILTALEGASLVHFQDFNAEVLRCLTIPNVKRNFLKELPELGFFAGDWSEVHELLLRADTESQNEDGAASSGGYDLILMAETVYDISSLNSLYNLIKKCMKRNGAVYMAGKKYYFGVGGGTRQFIRLVEEDGLMETCMISEVTDGASNVREVWKLSYNFISLPDYNISEKVGHLINKKLRHWRDS